MNILVVAPSWVGDTVLAQPMLALLRERHPQAEIDVLAPPSTLPLIARMPEVRHAIRNPFGHGELKLGARRRLGRELAAARYEQAIVLPNTFKSALPAFFAGIPLRTGYRGEMRWGLLNDVRRLDERTTPLMVQRFAALALDRGTTLPPSLPRPRLQSDSARQKLIQQKQSLNDSLPVAALCPGAEYGPAKRWPARHFAELSRRLRDTGHVVWLLGSAKDAAIGESIVEQSGGACINLCGRTTLDEAIDLIASATLVVTNDSGLMHVAAALDRPTVALYGSSSPGFTPPLSDRARIVKLDMPCSPCFKRTCPLGHFDCMEKLGADAVHANAIGLAGTPQ